MTNVRSILLASAAGLVIVGSAMPVMAADQVLNGAISSAAGEKLDGVTVSAKKEGSTITTSVYTDESGNYYFPPLPAGKYSVWAQALSFETARPRSISPPPRIRTWCSIRSPIRNSAFGNCRPNCWSRRCRRTPRTTPA